MDHAWPCAGEVAEAGRPEALCGTLDTLILDAQDQELQAWPQHTAAQLLVSPKPCLRRLHIMGPNSTPRGALGQDYLSHHYNCCKGMVKNDITGSVSVKGHGR